MAANNRRKERMIVLPILGALALNYPLLALFNHDKLFLGIPVLFLYLFIAWGIFIGLIYLIVGWGRIEDE